MKKNTLLYLLIAGGLYYYVYKRIVDSRKKSSKNKPYSLLVEEPTKISEQEYKKLSILDKVTPIAKKIISKVKEKKADKKKVGYFPDLY